MVKKPVVIPARPHAILSIGNQRFKIEIDTNITLLPNRAADVVPIDAHLKGEK